jgi:NAD dependent epimerase/dehydratase family enzyme
VRNHDFSKALGRALHRPAFAPVPRAALQLLYGDMASIVTGSQNVEPARLAELGVRLEHPQLDAALRDALSR